MDLVVQFVETLDRVRAARERVDAAATPNRRKKAQRKLGRLIRKANRLALLIAKPQAPVRVGATSSPIEPIVPVVREVK